MFDQTAATNLLALILNDQSFSAVSATNILLGTNAPTATANMTQLAGGSGYTTGGSSITWNAVSAAATSNSNAISWTNTGSSWSLVGLEIWNSGASTRYLFGTWTGQPVNVATGNTFQVAIAGIAVSLVLPSGSSLLSKPFLTLNTPEEVSAHSERDVHLQRHMAGPRLHRRSCRVG